LAKLILLSFVTFYVCLFAVSTQAATIESVRSFLTAGRTVEALREIETLKQQSGGNPDVLFEIGILFQELAASRAQRLEEVDAGSPQVQELLGRSLESHNRLSEALARYQAAAEKNPALPGIHFLIGNLYWKQRDFNAALRELQAELRVNPHHSLANLRMGEILLTTEADEPAKALPYLQKAAADPQANIETHLELGKALRMVRRYDEAFKELEWVAVHQPENNRVHAQLAAVYRGRGNPEAANREMRKQREILQKEREASIAAQQERAPK
jgi:tetratricopeptide (TPR) repeat protein